MKDPQFYKLNKHNEVVPCSVAEWHKWIITLPKERTVGQEKIGDFIISTVFLGADNNLFGQTLEYFETMVFHHDYDHASPIFPVERYETYRQALYGHALMVEKVKQYINKRK